MADLIAGNFLLRPYTVSDAPAFAVAVRESIDTLARWLTWARVDYSEADALAWFEFCDVACANGSAHHFGIFRRNDGAFVGGAGLNQFNSENNLCNLGYWVRESAQRQGAALAAVGALSRYAFQALKQSRVEIVVAENNIPSFEVARRSGATHECLARNRLQLRGESVAAHVFSLIP